MDRVRSHFEEEAAKFDSIIVNLIPYYGDMLEALVSSVPFETEKAIRVIDLGSGTGTVSARILERYPNSAVTCVDIAENMLAMARQKLSGRNKVSFLARDFAELHFDGTYDLIVSSLALHHLPDDAAKKSLFARAYRSLSDGGIFLNADVVLGSSSALQASNMRKWREYMLRSVTAEEVDAVWIPKYEDEDRPAPLTSQLAWLSEAGFSDVDVVWKYYNFAVYGGVKASR